MAHSKALRSSQTLATPASSIADSPNFNSPNLRRRNIANGMASSSSALSDSTENAAHDSLPDARELVCERNCAKIDTFLRRTTQSELRRHLAQLYGFACSSYGLIRDEYRERIWPVLAETLPRAQQLRAQQRTPGKHSSRSGSKGERSQHTSCRSTDPMGANEKNSESDSDFESCVSNFSGSSDPFRESNTGGPNHEENKSSEPSVDELRTHKEWRQVELDVNRTLARFPPNISDTERDSLQRDLTPLIVRVLWDNPDYKYYQGFHDVCLTLLLAMDVPRALDAARAISRRGSFYNYLTASLEESAMRELEYMYALLYVIDGDLEKYLREAELGTLFALSWPITWFSHDLAHYSQIVVFFDLFLASHPMMPIYVGAALIAERREEVFACEPEMPYLHKLLNVVPETINVNRVLERARSLFARFPPNFLTGPLRVQYDATRERERRKRATFSRMYAACARAAAAEEARNATAARGRQTRGDIPRDRALSTAKSWWMMAGTAAFGAATAAYFWSSRYGAPI